MQLDRRHLFSLTSTSLAFALAGLAAAGACDQGGADCVTGQEGCGCRDDECLSGLSCRSGVCVDPDGPDEDEDDNEDDDEPEDDNDDGAPEDDDDTNACDAKSPLRIGGALETDVSSVVFDYAEVEVHHKRDVDKFEDGCVNDVFITLAAGDGCILQAHARDLLTPQSRLMVAEVGFFADSQCPNFPDAAEGQYVGGGTLNMDGSGVDGQLTIPQENAASACFNGQYTLHLAGTLTRGQDILEIYPSQITLEGDFLSTAVDRSCPVFP